MDTFRKQVAQLDVGAPQFRGGVVTVRPKALIPNGAFSVLQNVRGFHPGFKKRDGQTKLSTTSELVTKIVKVPLYNTTAAYAMGYDSIADAVWANAQGGGTGDLTVISTEGNNNCIVKESGGTYTVGRTFLFFDLSRMKGVCSSASLYIRLRNGTNLASVIAKKWTGTDPDLNTSTDPFAEADFDAFSGDYSAAVDLSGYSAEDYIEIPLDAGTPDLAVTDITAAQGNTDTSAIFAVVLTEYTHDDQNSAPDAAATHDCNFYVGTADKQPYLSLTMSTTEEILRLNQWSKGKRTERHLFAQIENGDLIEASDDPPTVASGDFGTVVYQPRWRDTSFLPLPRLAAGLDTLVPASFGNSRDTLMYSDGVGRHQIYTGQQAPIETFKLVDQTSALADNPEDGTDYTFKLTDKDPLTYATVSGMGNLDDDFEAFFIMTRFKAKQFNFVMRTFNGTSITMKMKYWSQIDGWTDVTITDGTDSGGATLGQDGTISWTPVADESEFYAFGENGYWYMFYFLTDDTIDADTTITEITYEGEWQDMENVWNGVLINALEIYHYDDSASIYYNYSGVGAELGSLEADADLLYFSSVDNLVGAHVDLGATPNTVTTTTITEIAGWNGTAWVACTDDVDGTAGFNDSGFLTWKRGDFQKREFNGSKYSAYWWRVTVSTTDMSDDVVCTIRTMPWYDINELGSFGLTNTAWKERGVFTFDRFPSWLYISENAKVNTLNNEDFAIMQAGDGRDNAVVASAKFHNELMVWQEEKGRDGGCLTLFEGYSPSTFGKLLLSAKIGSFSTKSIIVIDGANSYTRTDDRVQTLAFFISHYGIYVTDGSVVTRISDDIQNYFDLRFAECIRAGYEKQMFVEHDTAANVLRFGLVSGSTATKCNVFPIFDLSDWTWSFDVIGQPHSHVHEIEASSGQFPVLQIAAAQNGYVYKLNDTGTTTDDGTTVTTIVRPELSSRSNHIQVSEVVVRTSVVASGQLAFTAYEDGVQLSEAAHTISMDTPDDGQDLIRERMLVDLDQGSNVSLVFTHARDEECYLYDFNLDLVEVQDR